MHSPISIHSRLGNIALALIGVLFVGGALATFVFSVSSTWYGASFSERLLQLGLLAVVAAGVFLIRVSRVPSGLHLRLRHR